MKNEVGASICRFPSGDITFGPWSTGTPTSVNVKLSCPTGSKFHGIYHPHPGGEPVPSTTDLKSGVKAGARYLCIDADGVTKCYARRGK